MRPIIKPLFFLIILFFISFLPGTALAGPVEVELIKNEAIVGESLSFAIKFSLKDESESIDVSNVKYKGTALPYEVRSQSSSSFTMIVNGKTVRSSSDITKSYIFTVPATTVGTITLPEFSVSLADQSYRIKPLTFQVLDRPSSDDLQFLVTVKNPQTSYYPSQVIDLNCRVLYRNFSGSPSIAEISLPIMKNLSFELLPANNPNFELIINGQRKTVQARQGKEKLKGKLYSSLGFNLKFRLMSHGDFEFANYIKMIVETGKMFRQRSLFFGSELVREKKPIFADSSPLKISVLELPSENVPVSFNGAIGKFKIKVTPSSDTAIRVGDPVTLLIEISGRGTWEFVKSPPIHKVPAITDYFIVSQESVVGEINDRQSVKSFSVRLRVKSKTVKEIPPIPFTYFNLASRKYVTVYSTSVPITVFESSTTAQITDFNAPPKSTSEDTKSQNSQNRDRLQEPETHSVNKETIALPGAVLPPLIQIADNVPLSETTTNHAPVYSRLLFALLPLAGVFILFLIRLYQNREISDKKVAINKSNNAHKQFQQAVKLLDKSNNSDLHIFCRELGRCVHQYLEERFICTFTNIDKSSIQPLIDQGEMNAEAAQVLLEIVEEIDQHRYSADLSKKITPAKLMTKTLRAIEKCNF